MTHRRRALLLALTASIGLASCTATGRQRATQGAVVGGLAGAVGGVVVDLPATCAG